MSNEDTAKLVSPTIKQTNYSFYFGFNFEPMFDEQYEPDNWRIAVNNENFRKSIYHGLDRICQRHGEQFHNPQRLCTQW